MLDPPTLSTLVIDRSATLSVSVAETSLSSIGLTVAVFENVPVAVEGTVPVIVYVTVLPAGRSTSVSSMLPEPVAEKPLAPPVSVAVQVSPFKSALSVASAITANVDAVPVLLTTTV